MDKQIYRPTLIVNLRRFIVVTAKSNRITCIYLNNTILKDEHEKKYEYFKFQFYRQLSSYTYRVNLKKTVFTFFVIQP